MKNQTILSIVIPTHNKTDLLKLAYNSIVNEKNFEIKCELCISDNSNNENTNKFFKSIKVPKNFNKERYYLYITLFSQIYWGLGCTIGAISSGFLTFNTDGMEFAATALFVVLLIEQWIMVRRLLPFILGFIASIFALIFFVDHMLLSAILISIGSIILLRIIKTNNNG